MIKSVAIVGFIGLLLGSILIYTRQSQPLNLEPVEILTSEAPTLSPAPKVELTEEAPTTNSVKQPTPTTKPSIKVANLVVPKTELEQDTQIDQNTLKNVEQDARLDNLENTVPVVIPQPLPPIPTPIPPSAPADTVAPTILNMSWAKMSPNGRVYYGTYSGMVIPTCWNEGSIILKTDEVSSVTLKFWTSESELGIMKPELEGKNGDVIREMLERGQLDGVISKSTGSSNYDHALCYQGLGLTPGLFYWLGVEATDQSGNTYRVWSPQDIIYYPR